MIFRNWEGVSGDQPERTKGSYLSEEENAPRPRVEAEVAERRVEVCTREALERRRRGPLRLEVPRAEGNTKERRPFHRGSRYMHHHILAGEILYSALVHIQPVEGALEEKLRGRHLRVYCVGVAARF